MFKSFKAIIPRARQEAGKQAGRGAALYFEIGLGLLLVLNVVALYFYFVPPGGSQEELEAESARLKSGIAAAQVKNRSLGTVSGKVESAGKETLLFEETHFLPRRSAYERVVAEVQRLSKVSNLLQKDGTYAEEPIEGSRDLTLVTVSVNLEGTYAELMHFLNELDHSPSLLILDSLNAAPLQASGRLNLSLKFLTILREDPALLNAPVVTDGGQQ